MNQVPDNTVPRGLADVPLPQRQKQMAAQEREIREGVLRRHFTVMEGEKLWDALHFAHALQRGPALREALDRLEGR